MASLFNPFQPTLTQAHLKQHGLTLTQSLPCDALQHSVHSYLQIRAQKATPYTVIPDASQAIFISPHGAQINGALYQACEIPILQPGEYFGIRFYPGSLRHFFDLNLSEISNQFVDHQYLPCHDFHTLQNTLYETPTFHARAQLCEQWLLQHFKPQPNPKFEHALSLIYQSLGNIKIKQLAMTINWSSRHLNRLFRYHTGLSSQGFAQTIRLQHACKQLYMTPNNSLNTALELGFFDQSHLISDFKKRLLANPSTFFNRFMSDFYNQ